MGQYTQMATQIIGTELQGWAALLEQQAMQDALNAEMSRQRRFMNEGTYQLRSYLPKLGSESATQQLGQASQARQSQYAQQQPVSAGPGQPGMSKADMAQLQLGAQNRANLGAYGDWQTNQGIASTHMQDIINRIAARAQGQQQVFPYLLNEAQHSQDLLGGIGAAIQGMGGSGVNWSQFYGNPYQNQQQMIGQQQGYGGAGIDTSSYGSPYTNVG